MVIELSELFRHYSDSDDETICHPFSLLRMAITSSQSSKALLFFLIIALSLSAGLGLRQPSPPDEPRFVLAARHMVESGDWLVPHRGREFYAEKPPVFMWLQASAYSIVKNWRIAFLLPSLFAALATLWLTWDLAARLWGRRVAPYAVGALWVCLQFGLQAKRGQIDMLLVFLTTLSLWGLLRHLLRGPAWWPLWLGVLAAGVGTVTKGVGFLPLLVFLPWALAHKRMPSIHIGHEAITWRWLLAVLMFPLGAAVWLGPLLITLASTNDPALQAYTHELLYKQTAQRYANPWHHVQPFWYYLQVVATLWLPGALLLPWLIPAWWRRLRRGDSRQLLLLGWCLMVLLFFSASPGKRGLYIFPALPAICLAAAPLLPALLRRKNVRITLLIYLLVMSLAFTLLAMTGLLDLSDWAEKLARQRAISTAKMHAFLGWLLLLGLSGFVLAAWNRLYSIGTALVLFTAVLWAVYGIGLAPTIDTSSSARGLMQKVEAQIGPDAQLGMVAWREQNLLQTDRAVVEFGFKQPWHEQWREASAWLTAKPEQRWLFVLDEALSPCIRRTDVIAIGQSNRRNWLLVPGNAVMPGCITPPFGSANQVID